MLIVLFNVLTLKILDIKFSFQIAADLVKGCGLHLQQIAIATRNERAIGEQYCVFNIINYTSGEELARLPVIDATDERGWDESSREEQADD